MKFDLVAMGGFAATAIICGVSMATPARANSADNAREIQITYQLNDDQISPARQPASSHASEGVITPPVTPVSGGVIARTETDTSPTVAPNPKR